MTLLQLIEEIVRELDRAGIPYMISGSVAATVHGEPRATQDVDIVIDPTPDQLGVFVAQLGRERFYVGDALRALDRRDLFNIVDQETGWKVDLIVRKERPFSRKELDRRALVDLGGVSAFVTTPEDTILAKLEWGRLGESDRQLRDAVGIISVAGEMLDVSYLRHWADELGIRDDLERALDQSTSD